MTQEQRKNLAILTMYCHSLPPDYKGFNMMWFLSNGGHDTVSENVREPKNLGCGTSACFAGHGPVCGVTPLDNETWGEYISRCFGSEMTDYGSAAGNYDWLFHNDHPNDISLACKRAAFVLEGKMDEDDLPTAGDELWDEYEQRYVAHMDTPEGFDTFTPDWDLITRIAEGGEVSVN